MKNYTTIHIKCPTFKNNFLKTLHPDFKIKCLKNFDQLSNEK